MKEIWNLKIASYLDSRILLINCYTKTDIQVNAIAGVIRK